MNHGKVISVLAAGQAGMFHREVGHWPADRADLIAHGCPGLDEVTSDQVAYFDEEPPPLAPGCQFFITLPYQLELQRREGNLRMVLRDQSGKLVCQLMVIAPRADDEETLIPQIVLRTTLFRCPGEGKSFL